MRPDAGRGANVNSSCELPGSEEAREGVRPRIREGVREHDERRDHRHRQRHHEPVAAVASAASGSRVKPSRTATVMPPKSAAEVSASATAVRLSPDAHEARERPGRGGLGDGESRAGHGAAGPAEHRSRWPASA